MCMPLRNTEHVSAKRLDLVHAMRDEQQRHAGVAQSIEDRIDLLHIRRGERGGRLVQDQQARIAPERFGDFHHLAARQRQILDEHERD